MAIGSDLAGVFSLIQQQQALEQRKEEGHQSMALNLLSMQMREAESTKAVLLKEYYDKKAEVRQTEDMFDQYNGLKPSDVSQGGRDIISIVDEQNKISVEAITQNLDALGTYQSGLESSLGELRGQAQTLREMQTDFSGINKVLDQHEYEEFQEHALQSLEEGGLGWSTTAGADKEYYKTDPSTRWAQAYGVTNKLKADHTTSLSGNKSILVGLYTNKEDEDIDDLVERLSYTDTSTGKVVEPDKNTVITLQRMLMAPTGDFMSNLMAYPADAGGDALRAELANNPNTGIFYSNMINSNQAITTLDNELSGMNDAPEENNFNQFVSSIEGISNIESLFQIYDQTASNPNLTQQDRIQLFSAIEGQSGGQDLGELYTEFKKGSSDQDDGDEPLDDNSEIESSLDELRNQQSALYKAGFQHTTQYDEVVDSLTVLSREFHEKENYAAHIKELERKASQGIMSEDELSDLSSLLDISIDDLRGMVEERRQQKIIKDRTTQQRSFYEKGLQE